MRAAHPAGRDESEIRLPRGVASEVVEPRGQKIGESLGVFILLGGELPTARKWVSSPQL